MQFYGFATFYAVSVDLTTSAETCNMAYFEADLFEMKRESSESDRRRRR